ncbi:MAG: hypothetical protein ACOCVN_00065 [bacterium]
MKKLYFIILFSVIYTLGTYSQSSSWFFGNGTIHAMPTTTKVGIGTDDPQYLLHFQGGTLTSGVGTSPIRTYLNFHGNYFNGDFESRIITAGNHSVQGQGYAISGILNLRKSSATSYDSRSSGGQFTINLIDYVSNGSKTHVVAGVDATIKGDILTTPTKGIFAAVCARDQVGTQDSYAGYFEGKAYFSERVGIGTTSPDVNFMLSVNGKIRAKEVVVETGWADFVFEDNYELMNLADLENYINRNNHLPGIPTEEQVINNGVSVGEMNSKLLQKIEELTLYVIQLNKEIETLKANQKQ